MVVFSEPTQELRDWYDDWLKNNKLSILKWLDADKFSLLTSMRDHLFVNEQFSVWLDDQSFNDLVRLLENGSLKVPKFSFLFHANSFLEHIRPKYEDALDGYLLGRALEL